MQNEFAVAFGVLADCNGRCFDHCALASAEILQGFPEVVQKLGLGLLAVILVLLLISRYRWKLATLASDSIFIAIVFLPKTLKVLGIEILPFVFFFWCYQGACFSLCICGASWVLHGRRMGSVAFLMAFLLCGHIGMMIQTDDRSLIFHIQTKNTSLGRKSS